MPPLTGTAFAGGVPPGGQRRRTYVLVPGAWHGGWCWNRVAAPLRAAGHEVYALTLTGLGDRAQPHRADIDLDTHIRDVVACLETEDLKDVVLVGHSYGGMVITGAAECCAARLSSMVYLDAFVPEDGKGLTDYIAPDRREAFLKAGLAAGVAAPLPIHLLGLEKQEDIDWVQPRLVAQPFQTFVQPIRLTKNAHLAMPRTYVYCSGRPTGSFEQFAEKIRTDPGWKYLELKTGHDLMVTAPDQTVQILLEAS